MNIPNKATVYTDFKCPKYPDLSVITYRVCLMRQLAKTPGQGRLYAECAECEDGKSVLDRFKYYTPEKKQKPNWNSTGTPAVFSSQAAKARVFSARDPSLPSMRRGMPTTMRPTS